MKKILVLMMTFLLAMSLMVGCSKDSSSNNGETAESEEAEDTTPAIPDSMEAEYNVDDYITMGDYEGLPYYTATVEITEEQIDEEINARAQYATEVESVTEGVVEDGDMINIAFKGKIDGEEFEGGSSESFDLTVGETPMIDGFVEGLVGKNVGETVTLELEFPDEYPNNPDLEGMPVVFDITINSKRVYVTPEINDEFAKAQYDVDTVEEMRALVKERLTASEEEYNKSTILNSLWAVIVKNAEVKSVPEAVQAETDAKIAAIEEEYRSQAEMYGMEFEEFLSTFMGMDADSFKTEMETYAEELSKDTLVLRYLCDKEGVTLTDKEYNDKLLEILANNDFDEESFQESYGMTIQEYAEQNAWKPSIIREKAMEKVLEKGKEVTKEEFDAFVEEHFPTEAAELEGEHDHDHDHDHEGETVEEGDATEGEGADVAESEGEKSEG